MPLDTVPATANDVPGPFRTLRVDAVTVMGVVWAVEVLPEVEPPDVAFPSEVAA